MSDWSEPIMTKYRSVPVWILTLVGAALPAFAAPVSSPAAPLVWAAETPSDDVLARSVLNTILSDEILRYDAANVHVSARNGVVTLSGTVRRQTIRQRMELVARSVKGASRVVNLLTYDSK